MVHYCRGAIAPRVLSIAIFNGFPPWKEISKVTKLLAGDESLFSVKMRRKSFVCLTEQGPELAKS